MLTKSVILSVRNQMYDQYITQPSQCYIEHQYITQPSQCHTEHLYITQPSLCYIEHQYIEQLSQNVGQPQYICIEIIILLNILKWLTNTSIRTRNTAYWSMQMAK